YPSLPPSELHVVVIDVPVDEPPHADLDWCARPVADVLDQILHVGPRVGDIAGLHRQEVLLGLASEAFLEHLDIAHQVDRLLVADVVETVRRGARGGIGIVAVPARIRSRYAVERAPDAADDVVDVREIAAMLAV